MDIPQSPTKGQESNVPIPGSHSIPILTASPLRAPSPKVGGWVSMTPEVRELLPWAALDTSRQALGVTSQRGYSPWS